MDKRGIAIVVTSVFIIFLTVTVIVLVWFWILPWFNEMDESNNVNANLRIDTASGYTAYDSNHEMALVQVKRGDDNVELDKLDVIFLVDGESFSFRTQDAPGNNQAKLYYFNFSKYGIGQPTFVQVVPVFIIGGREEVGHTTGKVAIPNTRVDDDWVNAGIEAEKNILKGDYTTTIEIELVDICKNNFVQGEVFILTKNYGLNPGFSHCFHITENDVVLDLNGHLINGSYEGYGVHIAGNNVTVKNGKIERFERGIFIEGDFSNNNTIFNNTFFDNNNSLYLDNSSGNYIYDNTMNEGYSNNIYLRLSRNNHITNNNACGVGNDIHCDLGSGTGSGNYGVINTFGNVVSCANDWLGAAGPGYINC